MITLIIEMVQHTLLFNIVPKDRLLKVLIDQFPFRMASFQGVS